jgi:hypothetical protein
MKRGPAKPVEGLLGFEDSLLLPISLGSGEEKKAFLAKTQRHKEEKDAKKRYFIDE